MRDTLPDGTRKYMFVLIGRSTLSVETLKSEINGERQHDLEHHIGSKLKIKNNMK